MSDKSIYEKSQRLSDASTLDLELSSDEELTHTEIFSTCSPSDAIHLFDQILPESAEKYTNLQSKLLEIFDVLDRDLEPVCIRDERSIGAASVNLSGILNSRLCRRRSTMTQSIE